MNTVTPQKRKIHSIIVCYGMTCGMLASEHLMEKLKERYPESVIELRYGGCTGNCAYANNLTVNGDFLVSDVTPQNLDEKLKAFEEGEDNPGGKGYTDEELDKAIEDLF